MRLLIVDDENEFRETLAETIGALGLFHEIRTCAGEEETCTMIQSGEPAFDVLVLDQQMEKKDSGLRILNAIRNSSWKNARTLFLTVENDPAVVAEVMQAGADRYLCKTTDYSLFALLKETMRSLSAEKRLAEFQGKRPTRLRLGSIEVDASRLNIDASRAFLSIPYREAFPPFVSAVRKTAEQYGLTVVSSDDVFRLDQLIKKVFEDIYTSTICLINISGNNPNVMLECGLAMALGKELVLLSDGRSGVPVDLNGMLVIQYDNLNLEKTLAPNLSQFFEDWKSRRPE